MDKSLTNWKPNIAIIGLGYVGLPLAIEFGKQYEVKGYDTNATRIESLLKGEDITLQSTSTEIKKAINLAFTTNVEDLIDCDVFIITVPTPVDENKKPDLIPLLTASSAVAGVLKKGAIVIYESTVYPGCTE